MSDHTELQPGAAAWLAALAERKHAGTLETTDLMQGRRRRLSPAAKAALLDEAERFDLGAAAVDEFTGAICAEVLP